MPSHHPAGLSDAAIDYIARSPAPNTRRAYERDWQQYDSWCAAQGLDPLPTTAGQLASWAAHLCAHGRDSTPLAPSTIQRKLAAVTSRHRRMTGARVDGALAGDVLRTYRADQGYPRPRQAAPVTVDLVRAILAAGPDTTVGLRDRALVALGFAAMRRRAELAGLDIADVEFVPQGMRIWLRSSKTDRAGRGRAVPVLNGATPETCPVRAVRDWVDCLAAASISTGPLLRRVDRRGRVAGEPGYTGKSAPGHRMTGAGISHCFKTACARAGLDPAQWSPHGLRAGGATSAAEAGAKAAAIESVGGWSPKSRQVHEYIRQRDEWTDHPMRHVGL
jgi:site-specific recombinase XerD